MTRIETPLDMMLKRGGPGPPGPRGATGATGAQGPAGSSGQAVIAMAGGTLNSGDQTLNSTSWANLPGVSSVVIAGAALDILVVEFGALLDNAAVTAYFDVRAENGSFYVYGGGAGEASTSKGHPAWAAPAGIEAPGGGLTYLILNSQVIVSGQATIRMRYRTASATNRTMYESNDSLVVFRVANLGQFPL